MEDELISQTTTPFHTYVHKISIGSLPTPSADKTTIIIQGFPYDEGTQINGGRAGAERGPFFFRGALEKSHNYPFHNIDKVQLFDNGDVHNSMTEAAFTLPEAHKVLEATVNSLYKYDNAIPFVVGGSNDESYCNAKGLITAYPNARIGAINIDAHFDVRPLKDGKAHSGSPFRQLLEDEDFIKNQGKFVEFAAQGSQCSKPHYDYLKSKGCDVYWLEKNLRRFPVNKEHPYLKTQAGQLMEQVLEGLAKDCEFIFFSFDIDAINSQYCPGVSAPSVVGGLTYEEAIELAYLAGRTKQVKLMDASEFNPAVENKKTAVLVHEIFYNFTKGVSER